MGEAGDTRGEDDFTFIGVCIAKGQHAPCKQRQGLETTARRNTDTWHGDTLLPKHTTRSHRHATHMPSLVTPQASVQ